MSEPSITKQAEALADLIEQAALDIISSGAPAHA